MCVLLPPAGNSLVLAAILVAPSIPAAQAGPTARIFAFVSRGNPFATFPGVLETRGGLVPHPSLVRVRTRPYPCPGAFQVPLSAPREVASSLASWSKSTLS